VFGFTGETNIGFAFYPSIQILPSLLEKRRCLIPSAIDQDPYWRIQRDIAESMGYYKAAAVHSKFLPALTGLQDKMSSSKQETTFLNQHRQRREKASNLVHLYKKDGALAREMWTRDFSKS